MKFYNRLESLLKKDIPFAEIGDKLFFAVAFIPENCELNASSFNIFEKGLLISRIKGGLFDKSNILFTTCEGDVIRQFDGQFIQDYVEAQSLSDKQSLIMFYVECRSIHFIINGKSMYYICDILQSNRPGARIPSTLPAREYRELVKRQFAEEVQGEIGFKYWQNRKNRILKDDPGTQSGRAGLKMPGLLREVPC